MLHGSTSSAISVGTIIADAFSSIYHVRALCGHVASSLLIRWRTRNPSSPQQLFWLMLFLGTVRCTSTLVRFDYCTGRIVFLGGTLLFPCATLVCMCAVVLIEAGFSTSATLLNIVNYFFFPPLQDLLLESQAACQEAASQRWRCLQESQSSSITITRSLKTNWSLSSGFIDHH